MYEIDPVLTKSNVDQLVEFMEALPAQPPKPLSSEELACYEQGFNAGRAAARRLTLDMWRAAELAICGALDLYGEDE